MIPEDDPEFGTRLNEVMLAAAGAVVMAALVLGIVVLIAYLTT